jgi:hypothetical protein
VANFPEAGVGIKLAGIAAEAVHPTARRVVNARLYRPFG